MGKKIMTKLGFDPRTFSGQMRLQMLTKRDNQLHHPANWMLEWQLVILYYVPLRYNLWAQTRLKGRKVAGASKKSHVRK